MKRIISQFGKTDENTGLKDIVSDIYQHHLSKVQIVFNTTSGIKSITTGWKQFKDSKDKIKKGYYYIVPLEVSKSGKDEEVFFNTQDLFVPSITTTLIQLGFKDKFSVVKTEKKTSVKEMFNEKEIDLNSTDNIEDLDFDNLEKKTTTASKNYKLGAIEILHKLFKGNNKIYWPNDVEYKKIEKAKRQYVDNPQILKVHQYKKLMGDTLVDNPFQRLTDLNITQTNFNVSATGLQPIVLELKVPSSFGKYVESVQYRSKVLVHEGKVRIPYLYAELDKETFQLLKQADTIKESLYKIGKTYKINLEGTKGNELPLVNPKIKNIPKDEIIDLAWDIETLKVRQTVYNRMIKELRDKTKVYSDFVKTDEDKFYESIGLDSKGVYRPEEKAIEIDPNSVGPAEIEREIGISIEKFPKTALEKSETELLKSLINDKKGLDSLVKQKEWLEQEINDIKNTLAEKRYKLSLIKTAFFVNGWPNDLEYWKDENGDIEFDKEVKAKNSYDGMKKMRYLQNKEGTRKMKIDIKRIIKEL